eukprot:m.290449 g.290449  ORF g.290449 m.290449 type:complete len:915 (+) comp19467_c0_seq1:217-2961(+)
MSEVADEATVRVGLLAWVNAVADQGACEPVEDLASLRNGLHMLHLLAEIFPELGVPTTATASTPEFNLQTSLRCLEDFFRRSLGDLVDLASITESHDEAAIALMLGWIVCAAVQSDAKENFIRGIQGLPNDAQLGIMQVIETHRDLCPPVPPPAVASILAAEQGAFSPAAKSFLAGSFVFGNTPSHRRPSFRHSPSPQSDMVVAGLRRQLNDAKQENQELHAQFEDVCAEIRTKNAAIDDLKFQLAESTALTTKVALLEEELDSLRDDKSRTAKLEAEVEKFKQYLEKAKRRYDEVKGYEKECLRLRETSKTQAEEIKRLNTRISQYRTQGTSATLRTSELEASLARKDAEVAKMMAARDEALDKVSRLSAERRDLQAKLDEASMTATSAGDGFGASDDLGMSLKIQELEEQTEALTARLQEQEQQVQQTQLLEDRLADQTALAVQLKAQLVASQSQVLEKDTEIAEVQEQLDESRRDAEAKFEERLQGVKRAHEHLRQVHEAAIQAANEEHQEEMAEAAAEIDRLKKRLEMSSASTSDTDNDGTCLRPDCLETQHLFEETMEELATATLKLNDMQKAMTLLRKAVPKMDRVPYGVPTSRTQTTTLQVSTSEMSHLNAFAAPEASVAERSVEAAGTSEGTESNVAAATTEVVVGADVVAETEADKTEAARTEAAEAAKSGAAGTNAVSTEAAKTIPEPTIAGSTRPNHRRQKRHYGSAPPWASSETTPKDHSRMTDANRLSELASRNKRQLPHLQSSYPTETQTIPEMATTRKKKLAPSMLDATAAALQSMQENLSASPAKAKAAARPSKSIAFEVSWGEPKQQERKTRGGNDKAGSAAKPSSSSDKRQQLASDTTSPTPASKQKDIFKQPETFTTSPGITTNPQRGTKPKLAGTRATGDLYTRRAPLKPTNRR